MARVRRTRSAFSTVSFVVASPGEAEERDARAVLLDRHVERSEVGARRVDGHVEVAGLADERSGLGNRDRRPGCPAGSEPDAARQERQEHGEGQEPAHARHHTGACAAGVPGLARPSSNP